MIGPEPREKRKHFGADAFDGGGSEDKMNFVHVEEAAIADGFNGRVEARADLHLIENREDELVVIGIAVIKGQQQGARRKRPCP